MSMNFFNIYNQDKNLHNKIFKDFKLLFKKTDFVLGSAVESFEKKICKLL